MSDETNGLFYKVSHPLEVAFINDMKDYFEGMYFAN